VDHIKVNKGGRQVYWSGWAYGVVDHCTFINGDIAVSLTGDDDFAWQRPIAAATADAVFIENNQNEWRISANEILLIVNFISLPGGRVRWKSVLLTKKICNDLHRCDPVRLPSERLYSESLKPTSISPSLPSSSKARECPCHGLSGRGLRSHSGSVLGI
jgi:hypothetical protein